MERMVEVEWYSLHDKVVNGEAIVEFARYDEDGKIVNEVVNVFLPEGVPECLHAEVKQQATKAFHNGEGYNL